MTDTTARALERRWSQTGALADWLAFYAEAARTGRLPGLQVDLGLARLELGARLGDPVACAALGWAPEAHERLQLREWVRSLEVCEPDRGGVWRPWAKELFARVAESAARAVLPLWTAVAPAESKAERALAALHDWLADCDEERGREVLEHGQRLGREEGDLPLATRLGRRPAVFALRAIAAACQVPLSPAPANALATRAALHAARATSPEAVQAAIRERVAPWVLLR